MKNFEKRCDEIISSRNAASDSERLHRLFDLDWEYRMTEAPEFATWYGYPGQNHRWTDNSREAIDRRKSDLMVKKKALDSIDQGDLQEGDHLKYDLFKRDLDEAIESQRFPIELIPIGASGGPHSSPAQSLELMPAQKPEHFQDMLSRLEGIPILLERSTLLMKEGLSSGITQPAIILRNSKEQINAQIVEEPSESPMLQPLQREPEGFQGDFKRSSMMPVQSTSKRSNQRSSSFGSSLRMFTLPARATPSPVLIFRTAKSGTRSW